MPRPISAQTRNEQQLKDKAARQAQITKDPVEKIRLLCLQRGTAGIMALGRTFRIMDDNRSGDLNFQEFKNGLHDLGLNVSDEEYQHLFRLFDRDGSGTVKYDEFLQAVRPPMGKMRVQLIDLAFKKLDKSGDGIVTIDDLKGVYNVKAHPEYQNGNKTEKQLLEEFLKKFEEGTPDGNLTKEEFHDYYAGVSASIDDDMYFDLMMRQCWKL